MNHADEALRLDRQLCFALYRASRALIRSYTPFLEPLGLTYPQYLVLLVLWEEDGLSVKHLGKRLSLDSATLTPLLKRLEMQKIVERRRDTEDERVVRIHLTPEGDGMRTQARQVPIALTCHAGFNLADPEALLKIERMRGELNELSSLLEHAG